MSPAAAAAGAVVGAAAGAVVGAVAGAVVAAAGAVVGAAGLAACVWAAGALVGAGAVLLEVHAASRAVVPPPIKTRNSRRLVNLMCGLLLSTQRHRSKRVVAGESVDRHWRSRPRRYLQSSAPRRGRWYAGS